MQQQKHQKLQQKMQQQKQQRLQPSPSPPRTTPPKSLPNPPPLPPPPPNPPPQSHVLFPAPAHRTQLVPFFGGIFLVVILEGLAFAYEMVPDEETFKIL